VGGISNVSHPVVVANNRARRHRAESRLPVRNDPAAAADLDEHRSGEDEVTGACAGGESGGLHASARPAAERRAQRQCRPTANADGAAVPGDAERSLGRRRVARVGRPASSRRNAKAGWVRSRVCKSATAASRTSSPRSTPRSSERRQRPNSACPRSDPSPESPLPYEN
jgi:hypothetical protein